MVLDEFERANEAVAKDEKSRGRAALYGRTVGEKEDGVLGT